MRYAHCTALIAALAMALAFTTAAPRAEELAPEVPAEANARHTDSLERIRQYLDHGNYELALSEADRVIVLQPRSPTAHLLRAEANLGRRDLSRALTDVTRAIDLDGSKAAAFAVRCELHLLSANNEPAVADCSKAIALGPASASTFASRGLAELRLKTYAAAVSDFDRSLLLRENAHVRFNRGLAHYHLKDFESAAGDFRRVLATDPQHRGAIMGMRQLTSPDGAAGSRSMEVRIVRSADPKCGDTCAEWISAEGDIDGATADKFRAVLRSIGNRKLPVFINSPGGRINVSMEVGRMIRARGLDVFVTRTEEVACSAGAETCRTAKSKGVVFGVPRGKLSMCASACANILAAGVTRSAGPSSLVGVHQAAYYTSADGERKRPTERKIPGSVYTRLTDYFAEMGVDAVVMLRLMATPHSSMYWFRRDELAHARLTTAARSGEEVVTGGESSDWMLLSPRFAAAKGSKPATASATRRETSAAGQGSAKQP